MRKTKSTYKRLLSVLLCLVMIMALAPMSVFAEGATANYYVWYHMVDENGYETSWPEVKTGEVGAMAYAPTSVSGWDGYDHYFDAERSVESGVIAEDGSLALHVYFRRAAAPATVSYTEYFYVDGKLDDTHTHTAVVGSYVSACVKDYKGYAKDETRGSVDSAQVTAAGATLELYYKSGVVSQPEVAYYTITFQYEGLVNASAVLPFGGSYTVESGEALALPVAPSVDGHTFDGWYVNGQKVVGSFVPVANTTVIGKYTCNAKTIPYTVNYYLENLNGGYTKSQSLSFNGVVGTTVTAAQGNEIKSFTGFTYQAGKSTATANIGHTSSTEMNLYYSRNSYTVTYVVDGKQSGSSMSYKYGEMVNVNATPTKKNYTFVGWNFTPALGSGNTMPASDVVISGEFTQANTTYTVITYRQNTKGAYDVYSTVVVPGNAGDKTTVKAEAVDGYKARTVVNKTIAEDGSTVIKVYYDIVYSGNMRPLEDVTAPEPTEKPVDDPYADLPPILNDNGEVIGYETEDGDVFVTEDGTAVSVEDPEVADIAEEDTPLAAGIDEGRSNISIILYIIIGTCLVLAAAIVYFKNKKLYNV